MPGILSGFGRESGLESHLRSSTVGGRLYVLDVGLDVLDVGHIRAKRVVRLRSENVESTLKVPDTGAAAVGVEDAAPGALEGHGVAVLAKMRHG